MAAMSPTCPELQYMRDAEGNRYTGIIEVAVGDSHLLALTNTGLVLAWGENSAGQLADGTLIQRAYPVYVRSSSQTMIGNITSIAARGSASIAVRSDGRVLGWGSTLIATPLDTDSLTTSAIIERPDAPYAEPLTDGEGKAITGMLWNLRIFCPRLSHSPSVLPATHAWRWRPQSNSSGRAGTWIFPVP